MQKTKLVEVIQGLNDKEIKRFDEYVNSPFFNKNDKVIELLKFLRKYHPGFDNSRFTKENAYKAVFGARQKFNVQKLRNIMSQLFKLLEAYLVQLEFDVDKDFHNISLLAALDKRYMDKQFTQKYEEFKKQKLSPIERTTKYYYTKYRIEDIAFDHSIKRNNRLIDTSMEEADINLDYYFLTLKLRYYCVMLNSRNVITVQPNMEFANQILDYLESSSLLDESFFEQIPSIHFYYRLLLLLKEEEDSYYIDLKELLASHRDALPVKEIRQIYTAVFNYLNKKLKGGEGRYIRDIYELYKLMFEQDILIENGFINNHLNFRNALIAGLRLGELEWAEMFIEKYSPLLVPLHRENWVNYSLAELNFYKKNYKETLKYLLGFEFKDAFNYADHKTLLAKTYYELEEDEALFALTHAFRIYLHRDTNIAEHFQKPYHNFIRLLNKLAKARFDPDANVQDIRQELQELKYITNQEWLLTKMDELE
ncbi:MAG: hypothetical protein AB8B69_20275 [Chitinophagales bacterium]